MNAEHLTDKEKTDMTFKAMFGDGNGDIGMKKKVDAMYEVFSGAGIASKIIKGLIYFGAAAATFGYVVWQVFHGKNPF